MFCDKCGKEIKDDVLFCRYCGAKVEREQPVAPIPVSNEDLEKPETEKRDKAFVLIAISLILFIGIIIAGVISVVKHENELVGEWIPANGFDVMEGMPKELDFEGGGQVTLYYPGDGGFANAQYETEADSDILKLSGESIDEAFTYKVTKDKVLYLDRGGKTGFAAYINLAETSDEQREEYDYVSTITDKNGLTDYLLGRWAECKEDGEELYDGRYFRYSEDNDGTHIRYNLPNPEHGEGGFTFDDNVIMLGDEDKKAFVMIPISGSKLVVYCYEAGYNNDYEEGINYYELTRIY